MQLLQGALLEGPVWQGYLRLLEDPSCGTDRLALVPGVIPPNAKHAEYLVPANCAGLPVVSNGKNPDKRLRPYQQVALSFILHQARTTGGAVLALQAGLGKTRVAAAAAASLPGPILVAGPLSALDAWCGVRSDAGLYGLDLYPIRGTDVEHKALPSLSIKHDKEPGKVDGYFVNMELLVHWAPLLYGVEWGVVIVDEAHLIRNPRTQAAKILRKIGRGVGLRLALTGTPVVNSVSDLWSMLDFCEPRHWGHWVSYENDPDTLVSFRERYMGAVMTEYGWKDADEETHGDELRERLASVLLRLGRDEVADQIPSLQRERKVLGSSQLDGDDWTDYCELHHKLQQSKDVGLLSRLLQLLSKAKRQAALDRAFDLAYDYGRLVLASWYVETSSWLAKKLKKEGVQVFGPLTGRVNDEQRERIVDSFVRADVASIPAVFLGTIGACGTALDRLSVANAMLVSDLYWVPTVLLQLEARVRRLSQKAASVYVEYLTVEKSVDGLLYDALERKAGIIDRTLSDGEAASLCEALGGVDGKKDALKIVAALAGQELEW